MDKNLRDKIKEIQNRYKQQSKSRRIRSALSIVIVISVLSSLLLPAFTLEKTAYCGMIEHTHTDECYQYILDCPVTGESGTVISAEEFKKLPGAAEALALFEREEKAEKEAAEALSEAADTAESPETPDRYADEVVSKAEKPSYDSQKQATASDYPAEGSGDIYVFHESAMEREDTASGVLTDTSDAAYAVVNSFGAVEGTPEGTGLIIASEDEDPELIAAYEADGAEGPGAESGLEENEDNNEEDVINGDTDTENTEDSDIESNDDVNTEAGLTDAQSGELTAAEESNVSDASEDVQSVNEGDAEITADDAEVLADPAEIDAGDAEVLADPAEMPAVSAVTEDASATPEVTASSIPEEQPSEAATQAAGTHVHTAACYKRVLICGMEEHTHGLSCFVDKEADIEDLTDLEALFPTFEDEKVKDSYEYAAKLAEFQKGYRESVKNYQVIDDGEKETAQGYTRYGDWAGDAYHADWSPLFAAFTAEFSGQDIQSYDKDLKLTADEWMQALRDVDPAHYPEGAFDESILETADPDGHISLVRDVEGYIGLDYADYLEEDEEGNEYLSDIYFEEGHPAAPAVGELVFLDLDSSDGEFVVDHVGIITAVNLRNNRMTVMVGNDEDRVKEEKFHFDDMPVLGYARLPETEEAVRRNIEVNGEPESVVELEDFGEIELESEADEEETAESEVELEIAYLDDVVTVEGPDYTVSLTVGSDARIPEWAEINVEEIPEGSPEHQTYLKEALAAGTEGTEISFARFFDISISIDGKEIEPNAPVAVNISYDDSVEIPEEGYRKAVHFADDGSIEVFDIAGEEYAGYEEEFGEEVYTAAEAFVSGDTVSGKDRRSFTQEFDTADFNKDEAFATARSHTEETGIIGGVKKLGRGLRSLFVKDTLDLEGEMGITEPKEPESYETTEIGEATGKDAAAETAASESASLKEDKPARKSTKAKAKARPADRHTFSFVQESFSVTGTVVYTVDFAYGEYSYSIHGGTSILLSDMVRELHISDNDAAFMKRVENVEFSDPALMCVTYINDPTTVAAVEESIFSGGSEDVEKEPGSDRELDPGEWLLTSLMPFKTEEALTITLDSGNRIVITVLDAQEVSGNTFITDAHLTIDGTTYGKDETWKVYPDVGYSMKLSFAEKGQNQFPAGGDTIVIDLPPGLTIPEGEHHTFTIPAGLAGSITGNEYWVENGKIYVKFGEDPEDILTRSSNAHFELTFTAEFSEGTAQIPFNDKVKPTIDMDITADVSVSKSASYNSATGKMDYTITVKSTGNSENVKVHDALTNTNLLKIDTGSITVSPVGTGYTVTDSSQGGFDMTIPSIGHNQTVTITYSADVDTSALDHKGNIKVSDDGKNTVTVENDDDDHDDDTNTYTNWIKYSSTSKTSTSVEDHEEAQTATLSWKIVLNDNYRGSIVGDKVWDTIDWSSKDAMKYTVDEDGKVTLHIAAKSQDGTKTYNTTATAAVVTDANGVQTWEYTIPQLGDDPDEILSYEITYTTEVDKTKLNSDSNGIVRNNTTNEGDGSSTGTGVVPIPHSDEPGEDEIVGGKAAVDVTEEYVDWDIVINVPAEGFPDGLTVKDYVPMAPQYGGFADTFDSILSVTGLVNGETYTSNCVHTDLDDNGNVISDLRNNNRTRDVVTIEFYQDAQKTTKGLVASGQARTLTIRIRTKNDPEWLAYVEREGSGDSYVYYHTNIAKANKTTFEGKAAPQKSKIYKSLIDSNETAPDDGMPVYRYAVDLAGVKKLPIVIEDTFNADELEYYAYWYETDTHQYIDGQSQRHMLNNGISPYRANIAAENGKITITAADLPRKENGDFFEYYRIYYKLKIKNQAVLDSFTQKAIENGGVYKVRNTAVWNGTDDHVDIEFKVPTVEKTGSFRVNEGESGNDRLYDFKIDINENRLELNGGESMDLTDTHTDNLTVDYTTIKVYKYVDGVKTLDPSIQWNFNGNIGTFYGLQDRTHYAIEYSCLVIGSAMQKFSNYAEMNGFHGEKHDYRDFGTTVDAGATVFQIGLIKYKNGMTSQGLAGATFQLFRGTGSFHEVTNGTNTWMEEDRIPMTWGVGTETAGKVGQNITFTTGEDGYVLIALNQTNHGAELEEGVHYFLKEIETPAGYQIDSSVEYWEFTLTQDPDEVCYGTKRDQYGNRLWIYFYYDDILKMNNTETDEPITVNVDKEWFDIDGDKIENDNLTAKVQLYQKINNGDYVAVETITNIDGTTYNGEITLPLEGSWAYSWEKLPRTDTNGNGYAYKLEEVEIPEDYVSSYTLNETENEKSYHLKNYQVTERKVNVSVTKTWLDEDGKTEIAVDALPEDLQEVRFYLYRVVSRAPFTTAPTSGGNPYTIEGNPYLVTGSDAEDGLYSISRTQFQDGISFEELPSVHKEGDIWYFYSYYVKEVPVAGYTASVDVTETKDAQNNTILLSSMKNRKNPEERTTNVSVQKFWKDKEGKEKSWPSNTVVRFKLYQVTSTQPFAEQPTSGGALYNVAQVNNNDHPNKVSGQDGLYQIGHSYNGSVLHTANFENLPEVTVDAKGHATYYAYYVDEVEVTGYETTYSYDTSESGKVKVTMTNRQEPDYTQLAVQKKWYDGDDEITDADILENLSASVELVRYRAVPIGTTVHFTMYNSAEDLASVLVPRNQADVDITIDSIDGGANAKFTQSFSPEDEFYKVSGTWWGWISGETTKTITIPDVPDVYVVFGDGTVNSISVSATSAVSGGPAAIDETFDSSEYRQTLTNSNSFSHTYTKLLKEGKVGDTFYVYSYGIREVSNPTGFEFDGYGGADINNDDTSDIKASMPGSDTIVVKNKKTTQPTGALKLTKVVKVDNNNPETDAEKQLVNGKYVFTISHENSIVKYVQINVENGVPTSYKLADTEDGLESATSTGDGTALVSDLAEGDYVVTEVGKNGMTLIGASRGDNNSDAVSTDMAVTVHVTAGQNNPADTSAAVATFTNNIDTDFEFGKQWFNTSQEEIEWDQDIQVTVSRKKANGDKDTTFSLVYSIPKNSVSDAAGGTAEFSTTGGAETDPKLKLTITTEGDKKKYNFKIEKLAYSGETDGKYTYYVEETNPQLTGYLAPGYSNEGAPTGGTAALNKGTIINKQEGGYQLPSTGGHGTAPIRALGLMLMASAAGLGWAASRRRPQIAKLVNAVVLLLLQVYDV